jgi:hypothetical protein
MSNFTRATDRLKITDQQQLLTIRIHMVKDSDEVC